MSNSRFRRTATRVTVPIAVAALVVMAPAAPTPTVSPAVQLSAKSTALIMGGTMTPTWRKADIDAIMNQFITPTHPTPPGQTIEPVAVTTPEEAWPLTGLFRLISLVTGPSSTYGPGGAGWPDEPWWKLSGLFDLTYDRSVQAGLADLEVEMANYGNDHLVIYGFSQGAEIATLEKRKLAEQYPDGTEAADIDFVLSGDFNLPNGGAAARFPGLYIPILDFSFNGAEPTDTQFHTDVITRQYDLVADFPLYPLNLVADLNALLGFFYVHTHAFDVSLAPDLSTPPPVKSEHGDTTYYFFETQDLPLFGPLRSLGVPEALIDIVEPFFRVLVELGYDRTIPAWEPAPARFTPPPLDLGKLATNLVGAIGEGIDNAFALFDPPTPTPLKELAPARSSAPATETAAADFVPEVALAETVVDGADAVSTTEVTEAPESDVVTELTPAETVVDSADEVEVDPAAAPTETADETTPTVSTEPSAQQEPMTQRPGGQPTDDECDGAPEAKSTSSPTSAGSSPKIDVGQNNSPDATGHEDD